MVLNIFDLWNALIPKSDIPIVPKTFIISVFGGMIIILENVHRQEYHGKR